MNKALTKQFFPIIVVIFILSVVYWINYQHADEPSVNQCYLDDLACELTIQSTPFLVQFSLFPVQIEEPISVTFSYSALYDLNSAWLEGTNMFMGRINIHLLESKKAVTQTQTVGELFIGACSESDMRWRMVINLTERATGIPEVRYVYFQTHYN